MPLLRTYSLPSTLSLASSSGIISRSGIISPAGLASPAVGLESAGCPCNACCGMECQLDMGDIAFSSALYGSFNFSPSSGLWMADDEFGADTPADNEYKAWIKKSTVTLRCDVTVLIIFGRNVIEYDVGHPSYPGSFLYGPTSLIVSFNGNGEFTVNRSGSGTYGVGGGTRSSVLEGSAVGFYEGTAEVPTGDPGNPVETDTISITVKYQRVISCSESVPIPESWS